MPKNNTQPRTSSNRESNNLTDQEILDPIWVGKKSGNLFKAVDVKMGDDGREVTYRKSSGEVYTRPAASFISRMRHATLDDLWKGVTDGAGGADGENSTELLTLVQPDHRHDLARMILYPECREEITVGINRIVRQTEMEAEWALSVIEPNSNRCILNFFGPPGTGKTLAAVAVAKILGKKLLKIDYSEIVSKYVGDTAKHIRQVFKIAKESNAALMFDEADALLSKRLSFNDSSDGASVTGINQNRNVLLDAVDSFNGVVIMCTNFFGNYDEAFLRRIARHVEFKLPNVEMREQLFKLHLPKLDRIELTEHDWQEVANLADGFSGGDICNVAINSITRASLPKEVAQWKLTAREIKAEIDSVKTAKKTHASANRH
jgi:hypothetical protein